MRIVNFENEPQLQNVGFKKETLIVMSRSKKVIVLEKSHDILTFKWFLARVCNEIEENDKLGEIYSTEPIWDIRNCFEREYDRIRNRKHKGINLIICPIPKEPDESFDDDMTIRFGTTSEDIRIDSDNLVIFLDFLNNFIDKLKHPIFGANKEFFTQIRDVIEEDLILGMMDAPYFKVEVVEGWELQ